MLAFLSGVAVGLCIGAILAAICAVQFIRWIGGAGVPPS